VPQQPQKFSERQPLEAVFGVVSGLAVTMPLAGDTFKTNALQAGLQSGRGASVSEMLVLDRLYSRAAIDDHAQYDLRDALRIAARRSSDWRVA